MLQQNHCGGTQGCCGHVWRKQETRVAQTTVTAHTDLRQTLTSCPVSSRPLVSSLCRSFNPIGGRGRGRWLLRWVTSQRFHTDHSQDSANMMSNAVSQFSPLSSRLGHRLPRHYLQGHLQLHTLEQVQWTAPQCMQN